MSGKVLWAIVYREIKLYGPWKVIFDFLNIRTRHNRTYKPIFIDITTESQMPSQSYDEELLDDNYEEYNDKSYSNVKKVRFKF